MGKVLSLQIINMGNGKNYVKKIKGSKALFVELAKTEDLPHITAKKLNLLTDEEWALQFVELMKDYRIVSHQNNSNGPISQALILLQEK